MSIFSKIIKVGLFFIILISNNILAGQIYTHAKIYFDSMEELDQLKIKHLDIIHEQEGCLQVIISPENLNEIKQSGFKTEIVIEDMTAFYQSKLDTTRELGGYKTLDEIYAYLDRLTSDYPNLVSNRVDIGLSVEGRSMWAIKISDNPNIDEDEPEILYTATIHAREVINVEVLLYFMDYLTDNYGTDPEATFLVENREIWFIPVFNVDGYYYNQTVIPDGGGMWRKNRRINGDGSIGVDLNRNWGYYWGFDDFGSSPFGEDNNYRGTGPFSEPETQNVSNFIIDHEFVFVIDYHSSGDMYCLPYGYDRKHVPEYSLLTAICDSMYLYNNYITSDMGINGCSSDWEYGEQSLKNRCLSILVEVGELGILWPPFEQVPEMAAENLEPNKLLAYLADEPYAIYPPKPPTIVTEDTVSSTEYKIEWIFDDSTNVPASFELAEYCLEKGITDPCLWIEYYDFCGFDISETRYNSAPSSFHSEAVNNDTCYFQSADSYYIHDGDSFEFLTYYEIQEKYDYAYFEVSTDGMTFTPIPGNITTNYNPYGYNRGNGITGTSGGWIVASFDVSAYAGQSIYFRISYHTDNSMTQEGLYIDDISPVNGLVSRTVISSDIVDTFYTFNDHQAGMYYYQVRTKDIEDQWGDFSDLGGTIVVPPYICGDVDGIELINILDIVFLINYKYKGGPSPEPLESADVDGIPPVNILDIVYLINFKYKSGPAPDCP